VYSSITVGVMTGNISMTLNFTVPAGTNLTDPDTLATYKDQLRTRVRGHASSLQYFGTMLKINNVQCAVASNCFLLVKCPENIC